MTDIPAVAVDVQVASKADGIPAEDLIRDWVRHAVGSLLEPGQHVEISMRIVEENEIREMNRDYRDKDAPTNVLAFPVDNDFIDYEYLGDLVVCAPVVVEEAAGQGKTEEAHWAHLVVHGMLHLQGFEHESDAGTARMEALEARAEQ